MLFSHPGARIGPHVRIVGPRCHLGRAHIGRDVLIAAGVHIPSGPQTHGTDALDIPIRLQPGNLRTVSIGAGACTGSAAVIMADVAADTRHRRRGRRRPADSGPRDRGRRAGSGPDDAGRGVGGLCRESCRRPLPTEPPLNGEPTPRDAGDTEKRRTASRNCSVLPGRWARIARLACACLFWCDIWLLIGLNGSKG